MIPKGSRRGRAGAPRLKQISPSGLALLVACLAVCRGDLRAQAPARPPLDTAIVNGELMVRISNDISTDRLATVLAALGAVDVKTFETVEGLHVIRLPSTTSVAAATQLAKGLDGVLYAEPNYVVSTQLVPNDPSFGDLWGLRNTGQSAGTPGADIHAAQAWDITTGSSDVVVVGIDTGIDYNHPDLAANMFRNEPDCNTNGIDDDGNGSIDDCVGIDTINHDSDPMDDNGHGTHTAGTIGAAGNNGTGVVGVNWTVKMMACKFLGSNGSGSTADAVTCLDYVAKMKDRGVNIVATSNSWSGGSFSQALFDAIDAQRQRGILFIAAAGNATSDNDATPVFPASYDLPNVLAVASTTRTDALSSFSNRGRRSVHIGAPGSAILSTTPNNTFATFNGTSMATPHVTGVAALLKAQDPSRDWRAIRNLILAGGDDDPALTANTVTGKRLNAFRSMTCSHSTVFSRLKPLQDVVFTTPGTAITLSALNVDCAAGNGNVAVTVNPGGQVLTLFDDGAGQDKAANDGVYTGTYAPSSSGEFNLTFPGGETVTVDVLSTTPYSVGTTTFSFRDVSGTNLNLSDDTSAQITPPFPIRFGGASFSTLFVSSNGNVNFQQPFNAFSNAALPTTASGGPLIAPFWDDLFPSGNQNVVWAVTGSGPTRELVIEWHNVSGFSLTPCNSAENITFQIVFFEGRTDFLFNYADTTFGGACASHDNGASATVGVQTSSSVARQFSFNSPSLAAGIALRWTMPTTGFADAVTAGMTIRAIHITELRPRIDALRNRFGLDAFAWTDPSLSAGTRIRAVDISDLRTALQQAYTASGRAAPVFTDAVLVPGVTPARAAHIQELRDSIVTLESS